MKIKFRNLNKIFWIWQQILTFSPIIIPAFAGLGEFKVAMSLYTDATYRIPYATPPILSAEETLYVGELIKKIFSWSVKQKTCWRCQHCWWSKSIDISFSWKMLGYCLWRSWFNSFISFNWRWVSWRWTKKSHSARLMLR